MTLRISTVFLLIPPLQFPRSCIPASPEAAGTHPQWRTLTPRRPLLRPQLTPSTKARHLQHTPSSATSLITPPRLRTLPAQISIWCFLQSAGQRPRRKWLRVHAHACARAARRCHGSGENTWQRHDVRDMRMCECMHTHVQACSWWRGPTRCGEWRRCSSACRACACSIEDWTLAFCTSIQGKSTIVRRTHSVIHSRTHAYTHNHSFKQSLRHKTEKSHRKR